MIALAAVATIAVATGGSVLAASVIGANNTINACYENKTGAVRLVAGGTSCGKGRTAIAWNVQGPTGPAGAVVPRGPAGAVGPQGPAGGILGYEVLQTTATIAAGAYGEGHIYCPAGKVALGGGGLVGISVPGGERLVSMIDSHPTFSLSTGGQMWPSVGWWRG